MCTAGLVVAVAPLMGSAPHIDKAHGRWLHVHVRPPVRGLLKVVKVIPTLLLSLVVPQLLRLVRVAPYAAPCEKFVKKF